jgi:hypothetical protein
LNLSICPFPKSASLALRIVPLSIGFRKGDS